MNKSFWSCCLWLVVSGNGPCYAFKKQLQKGGGVWKEGRKKGEMKRSGEGEEGGDIYLYLWKQVAHPPLFSSVFCKEAVGG